MSAVEFPPTEKVKVIGDLSRGEVAGAAAVIVLAMCGIMMGPLVPWLVLAVLAALWTFAPTRRRPFRVVVPEQLRWLSRRDKLWSASIRGEAGTAPFLSDVRVVLAKSTDQPGAVGVVTRRRAFTVMFTVERSSLVFATPDEQDDALASWGEVLGGLCVERNSELTAEFVAWTDVHHAADPTSLVRHHSDHGQQGPATDDYRAYLSGFGTVAAEHLVVVSATITQARRFRLAKQAGFTGTPEEVMTAAAVSVGRQLAAELRGRGFTVGALMSPAEISRLVTSICDPYRPAEPLTNRERFGLSERSGPSQVEVLRDVVAMDHAYHRAFAVTYPKVAVDGGWLWKPLSIDGPKVSTTVFEPVPPSRADREREASATRGVANNEAFASMRRGHVRERDRQKVSALRRGERSVGAGHQELDAYTIMVITARTREELDRRCSTLRQKLRESGRSNVRELSGEHDYGLALALPIGARAQAAKE